MPTKSTIAVDHDEIQIITAIRQAAPQFNVNRKRAEMYGIWMICYRRYCESQGIPWLMMDSVSKFMASLEERDNVSAAERDRALDGIMFYLTDVRRSEEAEEASARRGAPPESTRSLFAQLLLRCDIPLTQAIRLRSNDVDVGRSELVLRPAGKDDGNRHAVTLPPSVRTGLKNHLRRLQDRTDATNPRLFGHRGLANRGADRGSERSENAGEDVARTTKIATRVMQTFDDESAADTMHA